MNRIPMLSHVMLWTIMSSIAHGQTLVYPKTEKVNHVDTYYGVEVADPYRWLEEDVRTSKRVRDWVEAENKVTFAYLESLPSRDTLKARLTELWDYERFGVPSKEGPFYILSKNDGLQNHSVIYVADTLKGERRVLLNPNGWSQDGTTALGGLSFSDDGRYAAYGIQVAGSDWRTWKVREVQNAQDLSDTLTYLKFTSVAWDPNNEGFYYAKYPDPDPNEQFQTLNRQMKVMYHRLGTAQQDDNVIFYEPEHPEWGYDVKVTNDGRYLVLTIWVGTDDKYRIKYMGLHQTDASPVDLIDTFENDYTFINNDGPLFYFRTDLDAPNGRIIAIDIQMPEREHWKEVVPQADEPLQSVSLVGNQLVCVYLKDVTTQVKRFSLTGEFIGTIELPGPGTATGFDGKRNYSELFYSFQSYAVPPSIYRYDFTTRQSELLERPAVKFDPDQYVTQELFYPSKDGTRIPLFLTYKKGTVQDGNNPTLLYGYGGFNISILPSFSPANIAWMEMGGIYAVANIRGGGEYGQAWHEAGKRQHKQNVFDDFIAAAEYLIESKYTRKEKLAIIGRSNGGLLVGACLTQRPDFYGAAIPGVGVMDMLRFDAFTAGRFWTDDYGSAQDSKEMFEYLKGYSPYHNIKDGTDYPATLILTADTDDRVVPGHSFKFAARLQAAQSGKAPVLIRIETRAGHGSGKPTDMRIQEVTDIFAFLKENLDM